MTKKIYTIQGKIVEGNSRQTIANLRVEAWDKDFLFNDFIGSAVTDEQGGFQIQFSESYFREVFLDRHPDLFFKIFRDCILVGSTENSVMWNVKKTEIPVSIEVDLMPVDNTAWGWKLATTPDDAMNFLNGTGTYEQPVSAARIGAIWKDDHAEFYVFYNLKERPSTTASWGWKLATEPDDVQNFLSGLGGYAHPVKDAQIAAFWRENHAEFYVFYQSPGPDEQVYANWGWKLATDPNDAMNFMNGAEGYQHPVTTARIAALEKEGHDEFYIFYQRAAEGDPIDNWRWKLATDTQDVLDYLNGQGAYQQGVKGFEMGALWKGAYPSFYVFANEGTQLWLQSPLDNERFVVSEEVHLRALLTSEEATDGGALSWSSNVAGMLGQGAEITVAKLSSGTHMITVTGYGVQDTRQVRIFADLGDFYQAPPAPAEMTRTNSDFTLIWVDGVGQDELWDAYPIVFDQQSTDPSKLVIYAKLDVLRHQRFAEPLPFTDKTIFEHFKTFVKTLNLRLDCAFNTGGGGQISLDRAVSIWDGRSSGTDADPDACKKPFPNPTLYSYINPLYLLIHEGRHNEPDDPGHIFVNGSQLDPYLENGSGHAWAAIYCMWVYKYGIYDPPAIKAEAKQIAKSLLSSRFPTRPTHSNPKVQEIIDELLGP